jgi:hypothetical protein
VTLRYQPSDMVTLYGSLGQLQHGVQQTGVGSTRWLERSA